MCIFVHYYQKKCLNLIRYENDHEDRQTILLTWIRFKDFTKNTR